MKKCYFILFNVCVVLNLNAQGIQGAWINNTPLKNGTSLRNILIISDGYQSLTTYNATNGEFISTKGGSWKLDGDLMSEMIEFDSQHAENVGKTKSSRITITDNALKFINKGIIYTRIDDGSPGKLKGAWLMSGKIRNGREQKRDVSRPRKTMKILSGKRFQWIAYNTESKKFMATGGGTYSTINGEYAEHIEFFSKDITKVGMQLKFNYKLIDGQWNHTGFSSKGDPLFEIWSKRK